MPTSTTAPLLAGNILGPSGAQFVIAEWRDPGGVFDPPHLIAPLHIHHSDDEAWYVLEGRLCVRMGEQVVEAAAGAGVFVPRGTPHTYWNPGPEPLRYLLVVPTNIHSLIQEIHAMTERSVPALEAVFRKHDSEFLGF